MKIKVGILRIFIYIALAGAFCANAFEIDYAAINDDDTEYNASNHISSYSMQDTTSEDVNRITVPHDKDKGILKNEDNGSKGLKLEGINKNDLEKLFYGNELFKEMQN